MKSRFVKEQEAKGLLSNLGIKTLLNKIPLFNVCFKVIKMNEIVNKFLLAGDKFMSELQLKQPGFTYSACGPFTRNKEKLKNLCRQEIQILFTEMSLIKLPFNMMQLMVYRKIQQKELNQKVLRDKAFKIVSDPKYYGYQRGLASMVYKFFDKKSSGSGVTTIEPNYQLANALHKQIIRKSKRRKV